MAGLHAGEGGDGGYNGPGPRGAPGLAEIVLIHWARRRQGLILAPGNPLKIRRLADVRTRKARFVQRQAAAGSHLLLLHFLAAARMKPADLAFVPPPVASATE